MRCWPGYILHGPLVEDVKTEDISHNAELLLWERAVDAARQREHNPTPQDVLIPWGHGVGRADVCTLAPVPRPGRVTLFLRTSLAAPDLARRLNDDFFKVFKLTIQVIAEKKREPDYPSAPTSVTYHPGSPASVLLLAKSGSVVLTIETAPGDYRYGNVLALTSTTIETQEALEYLKSIFPAGFACIVPHNAVETSIETVKGAMKLVRRTGVAKDKYSAEGLATIFELEVGRAPKFDSPGGHEPHGISERVVARCVMGYTDASKWPSLGPTIQSIMVRRDFQGSRLVQDLFNAVESWFVEFWVLDTLYGNRVLKATQLMDYVVDRASEEKDAPTDQNHVLTDKILFYEVMHFAYNVPHPADPRGKLGTHLPPETNGIKYYPPTGTIVPLPTVYYSYSNMAQGWRSCDNCRAPEEVPNSSLLVCGNCKPALYWRAHYCSRKCQKEDWSRHKLWCGKSYSEVCAAKEAFEESLKVSSS